MPSLGDRGPAPAGSPVLVVPFPPGAVLDNLEFSSEVQSHLLFHSGENRGPGRGGWSQGCDVGMDSGSRLRCRFCPLGPSQPPGPPLGRTLT